MTGRCGAGVGAVLACSPMWCAWLSSRQIKAYRAHLAEQSRCPAHSNAMLNPSGAATARPNRAFSQRSLFGWVGSSRDQSNQTSYTTEPKWRPEDEDDTTTGAPGSSSGSGNPKRSEDTRPGTSQSGGSTEGLLEGQEPSFFSVVMGPRRALRVVNNAE